MTKCQPYFGEKKELIRLADHIWPAQTSRVIWYVYQVWYKKYYMLSISLNVQCQSVVYWYFTSPGLSLVGRQIRRYDGISRTDSKTSLVRRLIADEMRQSRELEIGHWYKDRTQLSCNTHSSWNINVDKGVDLTPLQFMILENYSINPINRIHPKQSFYFFSLVVAVRGPPVHYRWIPPSRPISSWWTSLLSEIFSWLGV